MPIGNASDAFAAPLRVVDQDFQGAAGVGCRQAGYRVGDGHRHAHDFVKGELADFLHVLGRRVSRADYDRRPADRAGQAHDLLGSYDKAISDLGQYIAADPSNPSGYLLRADAHTFHGRHEKAIEDYSNSIRLDPCSTDAYLGRAIAYAAIERYEEAIRDFKKALSQEPENLDALYDTAVVYMLANRPVEALSFVQKAVGLESDPRFKQESETLIHRIQKEIQAGKATQSSPEFLESDLAHESEPPTEKSASPIAVTPPQRTPEPVEKITGDWETTYMGSRIRLQLFHHEGTVIKGVFRIANPVGKEDIYHFTGTFENGSIQGSHHSGQSFKGRLNPNRRLTGVLRTLNGREIAVDFGLSKR